MLHEERATRRCSMQAKDEDAEVPHLRLQTIEGLVCLLQVLEEVEEILLDPSELDAIH